MDIVLTILTTWIATSLLYWIWMLVRMPKIQFDNWTQRIGFSAIVLKAACLWPISVGMKMWDWLRRQG